LIDSDLGKKIGFIRLMKAKCLNLLWIFIKRHPSNQKPNIQKAGRKNAEVSLHVYDVIHKHKKSTLI
jgi:hypothetical protein